LGQGFDVVGGCAAAAADNCNARVEDSLSGVGEFVGVNLIDGFSIN